MAPLNRRSFTATILITAVLASLLTYGGIRLYDSAVYAYSVKVSGVPADVAKAPNFQKFLEVIQLIEEKYYQNPKAPGAEGRETAPPVETLLEGAAAGAVAALKDPYSVYFDPRGLREFKIQTSGRYGGIGVMMQEKDGYAIVVRVFPGTPAATTPYEGAPKGAEPGLKPGDRIVEVEGQDVTNQDLDHLADLIRGPEGTRVTLGVLREVDGNWEELTFVLTRATITVPLIESRMLEPWKIGYISYAQFDEVAAPEFRDAVENLRKQGARALILDLRDNPGGLLTVAQDAASILLPKGVLAYVVNQKGIVDIYQTNGDQGLGMPLVVLVNQYTASASEILAGAIQDYGVGTVVGETTFGKAVVQQTWTFPDETGLKLTVGQWLTPKKRTINQVGIEPDVKVAMPEGAEMGVLQKDPQLQEAVKILAKELGEPQPTFPRVEGKP